MPTATAVPRRRRKATSNGRDVPRVNSHGVYGPRTACEPSTLQIPVDAIEPSPWQPRVDFADVEALAELLASQGQIQPITVRPLPPAGCYQLVDGERRWRAARLLGWKTIRAEVLDLDDAGARRALLIAGIKQERFSAIEEARAFRVSIEAGDAAGPTELAKQLGMSQGHVSNRLRLLELPEAWQQRVISREIPPTHARALLPYKDHPALLKAIDQRIGKGAYQGSLRDFEWRVRRAVSDATKPMNDANYYGEENGWQRVPVFKPTEAERADLRIVKVPGQNGKLEEVATNTKLWSKLQRAHAKQWLARHDKGAKASNGKAKDRKLTPAQQAKLERERAEKYAKQLWEFSIDWRRWLIARHVLAELEPFVDREAELLWFYLAASSEPVGAGAVGNLGDRTLETDRLIRAAGGNCPVRRRPYHWAPNTPDVWQGLAGMGREAVQQAAKQFLAWCFWIPGRKLEEAPEDGQSNRMVPADDVVAICALLEIDLNQAWLNDQAGPLSRRYWDLHRKDQLVELAAELKFDRHAREVTYASATTFKASWSKSQMVEAFLALRPPTEALEVGLPLPKELKKCKRPK